MGLSRRRVGSVPTVAGRLGAGIALLPAQARSPGCVTVPAACRDAGDRAAVARRPPPTHEGAAGPRLTLAVGADGQRVLSFGRRLVVECGCGDMVQVRDSARHWVAPRRRRCTIYAAGNQQAVARGQRPGSAGEDRPGRITGRRFLRYRAERISYQSTGLRLRSSARRPCGVLFRIGHGGAWPSFVW